MEDRRWLEPVVVVSGKHGIATVKGFGVVCGDEEKEEAHVSHAGRRSDERIVSRIGEETRRGEDSGSWVLVGNASGGGWR